MANSSHASAPSLLKFSGQRGWREQRRWGLWAEGLAGGGGCGLRGDWAEGAMDKESDRIEGLQRLLAASEASRVVKDRALRS